MWLLKSAGGRDRGGPPRPNLLKEERGAKQQRFWVDPDPTLVVVVFLEVSSLQSLIS